MRALKPGGTIVVSGSTSGPNPGAHLQRLFFLQLRGDRRDDGAPAASSRTCWPSSRTRGPPEIGLQLPMTQAEEGFRAMLDGDTAGKIVVTR
jgi:hypothetical protein